MGTRGIIARPATKHRFEGRYHHWDSYPLGLGKALWDAYHGPFAGDLGQMVHVLIDEHPGGWSTIVDADWSKEPGFETYSRESSDRPKCYCHGDRREGPYPLVTEEDDVGAEWAYVLDVGNHSMTIFETATEQGDHAFGMFGTNPAAEHWAEIVVVDLDGEEPDWRKIR